jgi:two-component system sensor histidine kinase KdpD
MENRPSADELLARIRTTESRKGRGSLKIFFGYAAGVGKTYTMLEEARRQAASGKRVLAGYIEPHSRPETMALLEGLPALPPREVDYHGVQFKEFDLDAALEAKPEIILVDELAHSNTPGLRHVKRWQDVQELLDRGITVYTTLNVQHIDSLNDIIARITGVTVRETVPDTAFEQADQIELVDIPPEDLLRRFQEGKVYVPAQAERAIANFFQKANLIALRELALRKTADRVGDEAEALASQKERETAGAVQDRLLVCVSSSRDSARLVRTAKRLASALKAEWCALHIEAGRPIQLLERSQNQLLGNFQLARGLGAEVVTLKGEEVARLVVEYARSRQYSRILVGKTPRRGLAGLLKPDVADQIIQLAGDIDVYVVRGAPEAKAPEPVPRGKIRWAEYAWSALILGAGTTAAYGIHLLGFSQSSLIMVLLLSVVYISVRFGSGPSITASILATLLFNLLFTEPYYTLTIRDPQNIVSFIVLLVISMTLRTLASRLRRQAEIAHQRENQTQVLYQLSTRLSRLPETPELLAAAEQQLAASFRSEAVILLGPPKTKASIIARRKEEFIKQANEQAVAEWVYERRTPAGLGTDTLPGAQALYLPLVGPSGLVGVLAIKPENRQLFRVPEQRYLLESFASQIALAIDRALLTEKARSVLVRIETEQTKNTLLRSISHDLRTPLAVIKGSAGTLLELGKRRRNQEETDLLDSIIEETVHMTSLIEKLLSMTRLESEQITLNQQWQPLDELVASALGRLEPLAGGRTLRARIPDDTLVLADPVLLEQVLYNLLENAVKYTPENAHIDLVATNGREGTTITVEDDGPGIPPEELEKIFDKFYRGKAVVRGERGGTGLGLAICRMAVRLHGGRIWAENREGGGARFVFTLPSGGQPMPLPRPEEREV